MPKKTIFFGFDPAKGKDTCALTMWNGDRCVFTIFGEDADALHTLITRAYEAAREQ